MPSGRQGSIHLFRFAGVDLFLHWSWFLIAIFEINGSTGRYSSMTWNVLEYLLLFLIVTLHEFGHALACRQVGGTADHIVLWPLGGVAYVDPPPRPGANLWSIAAGPLVNVVLLPLLSIASALSRSAGLAHTAPNAYTLINSIWWINVGLLVFNMLPIYPLDGGQIFRSLLWFLVGRARSLMVATTLGFVGVAGFIVFALWIHSVWIAVLAVFMLLNCWGGLRHAQGMARLAKMPRRDGFACPRCKTAPLLGAYWKCGQCKQAFDTFQTGAVCPVCGAAYSVTRCMDCGQSNPLSAWATSGLVPAETAHS
jgi:Zn-dependent protease